MIIIYAFIVFIIHHYNTLPFFDTLILHAQSDGFMNKQ